MFACVMAPFTGSYCQPAHYAPCCPPGGTIYCCIKVSLHILNDNTWNPVKPNLYQAALVDPATWAIDIRQCDQNAPHTACDT